MVGQAGQSAVNTFTTGFNFGGGGDFQPIVLDSYTGGATTGSINATIDTSVGSGQALQFSSLDLAGIYQGTSKFLLAPDHLQNCTGQAAGATGSVCGNNGSADTNPGFSNPLGYNVELSDLGSGNYGVVVTYAGTISGSGTTYDGNEAHWRLEGIMATSSAVPVPAAVWLFGSGLVGLVGVARRRKAM